MPRKDPTARAGRALAPDAHAPQGWRAAASEARTSEQAPRAAQGSRKPRSGDDMKILVVEDDATTSEYIAEGLRQEGHTVDLTAEGRDGLIHATSGDYDVMIIDRMLPGLDGMSLVKALRAAHNRTPVLFLTSLGGVDDRIEGLNAGGDDYLVKPFAFGELSARIQALGRRPHLKEETTVLSAGDLKMDLLARRVTRAGQEIDLLPREFALLEHLLRRKGRVQTRTMLLEAVWDISFDPQTNVVETHISRLRAKIDKPFDHELIKTVRGSGYRIEA
ncbi:two-component system, OmpR family, response regulator [Allgaiera indica]|uniref:Two-component system, OmpR family, response regulator n=2 Tax=Allgaiera indica TaxID=765699 RepID=A0A1H2QJF1_9RHOB|nr:two-component system, OmpR family, response regulator [Allgaiera indica]